jgi:hypothetical protein
MERDDSIPIDLDFIEKNLFGSSIYINFVKFVSSLFAKGEIKQRLFG